MLLLKEWVMFKKGGPKKKEKKGKRLREKTHLIHNLNSTSQPFIFNQIPLMPSIQPPIHLSHPALLPSRSKHDPGSGYFFVVNTPAADASNRNIIDELARMFEKTVLNFDRARGYLGTGDYESILNVKSVCKVFFGYDSTVSQKNSPSLDHRT
jgi:hypothetical protein